MFRFTTYLVSFVLLYAGLFQALPVVAATGYTVTPLAFNLNVEKRDILAETITLTNTSDRMIRLYASVNEVAMEGGVLHSFIEPVATDRTNTPTSWIEVTRSRIELAPGEVREIPVTIKMNPNTEPGNYSVFVGFAEASNQAGAIEKVMAGQAMGTLINLAVDTTQDQFLRLEKFKVDRFVTGSKESLVTYALENVGAVDVVHAGEVIFYNSGGEEVAAVDLNQDKVNLERKTKEVFTAVVPDLKMGKYRAYLSVEYGSHNTESLQDTTYFYVLPLLPIVLAFFFVLLLSIGIALYVHRRFDVDRDDHGAESVVMYVRGGESVPHERDIDLKRVRAENGEGEA